MKQTQGNIILQLNRNEALVLSEFLYRFERTEVLTIEDQAEARVFWDISCQLESSLFCELINNPNYDVDLAQARDAVRDPTA